VERSLLKEIEILELLLDAGAVSKAGFDLVHGVVYIAWEYLWDWFGKLRSGKEERVETHTA
jgi:hypothetical protein